MNYLWIIIVCIACFGLGACQVTARDQDTSITIDNNEDGYHHCPPGHAKKGWC